MTSRGPELSGATRRSTPSRSILIDLAAVLVFAAVGRRNHGETNAAAGLLRTAAPFLLGAMAGWALRSVRRAPRTLSSGLVVAVATVAIGMVLRRVAFDRGTAPAFVIVATVFNLVAMIGWRWIAARVPRRSTSSAPS